MDWLTFLTENLRTISWPIVILVVIFLLRKPFGKLIPLMKQLKYKDLELVFRDQLQKTKEEAALEDRDEEKYTDEEKSIVEMCDKSPRAAVLEIWQRVENSAIKRLRELLPPDMERKLSASYLEYSGALNPSRAKLLRDLYYLRNQAAHSPDVAITSEDALAYLSLARQIQKQINAISQLPKIRLTALTLLILEINHLIDTGKYADISILDIHEQIENGTVLEFLDKKASGDIDLSLFLKSDTYQSFVEYYAEQLQQLLNCYGGDERRKWGIENSGLCLLLAWTNEIIQHGSGWYPAD